MNYLQGEDKVTITRSKRTIRHLLVVLKRVYEARRQEIYKRKDLPAIEKGIVLERLRADFDRACTLMEDLAQGERLDHYIRTVLNRHAPFLHEQNHPANSHH